MALGAVHNMCTSDIQATTESKRTLMKEIAQESSIACNPNTSDSPSNLVHIVNTMAGLLKCINQLSPPQQTNIQTNTPNNCQLNRPNIIVLIERVASLPEADIQPHVHKALSTNTTMIYRLRPHNLSSAHANKLYSNAVALIEWSEFVNICLNNGRCISW